MVTFCCAWNVCCKVSLLHVVLSMIKVQCGGVTVIHLLTMTLKINLKKKKFTGWDMLLKNKQLLLDIWSGYQKYFTLYASDEMIVLALLFGWFVNCLAVFSSANFYFAFNFLSIQGMMVCIFHACSTSIWYQHWLPCYSSPWPEVAPLISWCFTDSFSCFLFHKIPDLSNNLCSFSDDLLVILT